MKFLFVDRITEVEPSGRIVGEKTLRPDEPYLAWHFPERPILPGNLIVEAAAQLAGWLVAASTDFERWLLFGGAERARFTRFVKPGDTVVIDVTFSSFDPDQNGALNYAFVARVDDQICASADCAGPLVDVVDLDDPARVREAFDRLRTGEPAA